MVACRGFGVMAQLDNAEPDINIARWNNPVVYLCMGNNRLVLLSEYDPVH